MEKKNFQELLRVHSEVFSTYKSYTALKEMIGAALHHPCVCIKSGLHDRQGYFQAICHYQNC